MIHSMSRAGARMAHSGLMSMVLNEQCETQICTAAKAYAKDKDKDGKKVANPIEGRFCSKP
jgi:hypothetical protein